MQNYNNKNRRTDFNKQNQGNKQNQRYQQDSIKCYPHDTAELLKAEGNKNISLKFHKFVELVNKKIEKKVLKENMVSPQFNYDLELPNLDKIELIVETSPKMIIGLGSESVYETSLTLHHVYSVPYIPGSALKGSFRSFIIRKFFENYEKKALKDDNFRSIFGGGELTEEEKIDFDSEKGNIIFFDSFPEGLVMIGGDILTPHFNDYYQHQEAPTDTKNPDPIPFLSVKGQFKVVIGIKENCKEILFGKPKKDFLKEQLKDMLTNYGVGGKTAVGYGYFKIISN
ncbi:MAG: type III-B CRISPR module RAMP protein Cmr6 [candidate division WOR-3 bacterium]